MASKNKNPSGAHTSNRYAMAKRYGRRPMTILIIILVALVALGLCGFRFAYNAMLPNVIEMTESEATALLEDYDMELQVQRDWSDRYEEGLVISQDPKGGTQATPGDTVTIVVSKGPQSVTLPELTNLSKEEAAEMLSKASVPWMLAEVYSSDVPVGNVISQNPAAGTEIMPGESVLLTVSKGDKPAVRTAEGMEATKKKTTSKDSDKAKSKTSQADSDDDDDDDDSGTTVSSSSSNSSSSSSNSTSNTSSSSSTTNSTSGNTQGRSGNSSGSSSSSQSDTSGSSGSSQGSAGGATSGSSTGGSSSDSGSSGGSTDSGPSGGSTDSGGSSESGGTGDPEIDEMIEHIE